MLPSNIDTSLASAVQPPLMLPAAGEPPSTQPAPLEAGPPTYELFAARTVQQAWREWKEGVCGFPPLEQLEREWGAALRPISRQGQAWHYRKIVLDEVLRLMQSGFPTPEQAVAELDRRRDGVSLRALAERLKKEHKERRERREQREQGEQREQREREEANQRRQEEQDKQQGLAKKQRKQKKRRGRA